MTVKGTMIQPKGGEIERVVDEWLRFKEAHCPHYTGFKLEDEDQCTHDDQRNGMGTGTYCCMSECPLLEEAMRRKGVDE